MENNEKKRNEEIENSEKLKIARVEQIIQNIEGKKSKFVFFIPKTNIPTASVYEIYFHATTVKKLGYEVIVLVDDNEYEVPSWIEKELTDFNHQPMASVKLDVSTEDILVLPDIFSNVMEKVKDLPCIKIGLLQSIDYMTNALLPAVDWSMFNIKDIVTTSSQVIEIVKEFYGDYKFKFHQYPVGIPDYFNNNDDELKRPVVSIIGRNRNEISKIVKLFYAKYPQYSWVTFDSMVTDSKPPQPLSRKDFAERMRKNFAVVWVDRISSFGTVPLEAMKSDTITISLLPDITPDYLIEEREDGSKTIKDNTGIWTNDIYSIPVLIGDAITNFLQDTIDNKVYETMKEVSESYTQENSAKRIGEIYTGILNDRVKLLKETIKIDDKKDKPKMVVNK